MSTPPDLTLAALRKEFPGHRIWLEPAYGRYRFVARRLHPGTSPHTVVTGDPAELRAALAAPGRPEPGPPGYDAIVRTAPDGPRPCST